MKYLKKILILSSITSFFCLSCVQIKNVKEQNKTIKTRTVYLKLNCPDKFDRTFLDTLITQIIPCYNQNSKNVQYIYINDTLNRENTITLNILKQNFASPTKVAINYGVSALGLIATPIYIIEYNSFGLFYFPAYDKIHFRPSYSNWNYNNRISTSTIKSRSNVLFRSRDSRNKSLTKWFVLDFLKFLALTEKTISKPYFIEK